MTRTSSARTARRAAVTHADS
eukprot:ctg_3897.g643